ncbi:30S ribosomal protein S3 [Striga asiatica]|uniref:30S ribosomal protein S3 n=1 Tax=Striga asiatica TaxID=4170 RepID=A0A5A7QVU1_STRAF|nr:30S ribosomal protein S3 [Striga asiatica]
MATVKNLFTTPATVNAVAEIAFRAAKPKKLMSSPNTQDKDTAKNATGPNKSLRPDEASASNTSSYSPVRIQNREHESPGVEAEIGDNVLYVNHIGGYSHEICKGPRVSCQREPIICGHIPNRTP